MNRHFRLSVIAAILALVAVIIVLGLAASDTLAPEHVAVLADIAAAPALEAAVALAPSASRPYR